MSDKLSFTERRAIINENMIRMLLHTILEMAPAYIADGLAQAGNNWDAALDAVDRDEKLESNAPREVE